MTDHLSPKFHAELIVVLFDDYRDLRKVKERVGVLLSDAPPEHIEAVGKYLPIDLTRVLPRGMLRGPSTSSGGERFGISAHVAASVGPALELAAPP
jgi:hypothetical protein